jgi:hypothetical protein
VADIQEFGGLNFNFTTQIIEIPAGTTSITMQDLYDAIVDARAFLLNMDDGEIGFASGKVDLGGGLAVGITLELQGGWRLKAADQAGPLGSEGRIQVEGGNLVTFEADQAPVGGPPIGDSDDPLAPASFVTYSIEKAVSATLITSLTTDLSAIAAGVADIRNTIQGRYWIDTVNHILYEYDLDGVEEQAATAITTDFVADGVVIASSALFQTALTDTDSLITIAGSTSNDGVYRVVSVDSETQVTVDYTFTAETAAGTVSSQAGVVRSFFLLDSDGNAASESVDERVQRTPVEAPA